ncbi:MAG: ribosome silencing factor [Fibrobacterota bacterium]
MKELAGRKLADLAAVFASEKKAEDILCLDLTKLTAPADYFLIATVRSAPQLSAVKDSVFYGLKKNGPENAVPRLVEGGKGNSWIILDYTDVVVHIFMKESREFYSLEKFWEKAGVIIYDDYGSVIKE